MSMRLDNATGAAMTAANGCWTVGDCYAPSINPEDPDDDLNITDFEMKDGKPVTIAGATGRAPPESRTQ